MSQTFLIVSIIILFILVVIRQIPWRDWAVKWVGNNPDHAQIYIHAGSTSRTVEGERIFVGTTRVDFSEGKSPEYHVCSVYYYKAIKKYGQVLFIDDDYYDYDYIRGRRILGVSDGMLVANPLGNSDTSMKNKYREGLMDISHLWDSMVVVSALKSVKSTRIVSYMLYVIIGLVALGGLYYYMSTNGKVPGIPSGQPAQPPQPAATQPAAVEPLTGPSANISIVPGERVTD